MVKIRHAQSEDNKALAKLLKQLFDQEAEFVPDDNAQQEGLRAILEDESIGTVFVVERDDTIVGMVSLLWSISTALGGKVAWLEDMVIDNAHHGNGLGSLLLEHALAYAKNVGCRRVTLLTDEDNQPAHRFYARFGFTASPMKPFRLIF
jgi:GNAT superfamily N-acetyltransferase